MLACLIYGIYSRDHKSTQYTESAFLKLVPSRYTETSTNQRSDWLKTIAIEVKCILKGVGWEDERTFQKSILASDT